MPEQSYWERIRHPSGALGPKRQNARRKTLLFVVVIGAALYFLLRAGLLSKAASTYEAAVSVPNPYGWK